MKVSKLPIHSDHVTEDILQNLRDAKKRVSISQCRVDLVRVFTISPFKIILRNWIACNIFEIFHIFLNEDYKRNN